MKRVDFKIDKSKIILPLLALAASTSTLFALPAITVSAGPYNVSCSIASSTVVAKTITVTLSSSPTTPVVISASSVPGGMTVTPAVGGAAGDTLAATTVAGTSTAYGTGVSFNITPAAYCAGAAAAGTNTVSFNLTGTNVTTAPVSVSFTVSATLTMAPGTPSALSCSPTNASPTGTQIAVGLTSTLPAGISVTIGDTLPGGSPLSVSVPATPLTSTTTSINVTISPQAYCGNAAMGQSSPGFTLTGTASGATFPITVTSYPVTASLTVNASSLTLNLTGSPVTLSCNTANGPGSAYTAAAQSITVALSAAPPAGVSISVAAGSYMTGSTPVTTNLPLVVTGAPATFNSSSYSTTLSINAQPYCANVASLGTSQQSFVLTPTVTGGISGGITIAPATVTVNLTVAAGQSPITVSPSAVNINCTWDGTAGAGHYTAGTPQYISVTGPSAANLSLGVDSGASTAMNWAVLNPTSPSGSIGATPIIFTVAAVPSGCNSANTGGTYSTHQGTIRLTNGLNQEKVINVTLSIVSGTPLQASLNPSTGLTYVKGSGIPGHVDVSISSRTGIVGMFFTVDTTYLSTWLTVDSTTGTTPGSLRFSSTSMADNLAPGAYTDIVHIQVSGYGDLAVTIPMQVSNPPSTLTVSGTPTAGCTVTGPTQSCNWVMGQPLPTLYINLQSSDAPIAYTLATGGTLQPEITGSGGLAYSFGTSIPVNFSQSAFAGAAPGTMVSGTVSITYGSPASTYVVTFNITAQAPGAILTAVSPSTVPNMAQGKTVTVVLQGSGFVVSTDPTQETNVGVLVSGSGPIVRDPNFNYYVENSSNIFLTITNPASADANLNFATSSPTGFPVVIGICNPAGTSCNAATGVVTLLIGAKPIITTATSASSYLQSASNPPVAPYDVISIFGTNLCPTCVGPNALYGTPQGSAMAYPTTLTDTSANNFQVSFRTHTAGPTVPGSPLLAPLLFASNNQVNLLVPSTIPTSGNGLVDIVVSFGPSGSLVDSNPYTVTAQTSDPGIFTIAADGQGNGAILDSNYNVIGQTNPVAMHTSSNPSGTVMIYMTGLGAPLSAADNGSAASDNNGNGLQWSTDCIAPTGDSSPTGYTGSLNSAVGASYTTPDGLILQRSLLNTGRLVPCLDSSTQAPTVTIGGAPVASIGYAGWVADSIAGLYQVNATLPSVTGPFNTSTADCQNFTGTTGLGTSGKITQPVQLPICIETIDGKYSQPGVMVWVAPQLHVAAPAYTSGSVGAPWATGSKANVVATEGSGSGYTYAVTSGGLPSGLALSSGGAISGTPVATGSSQVTVTATDTSVPPITGSVTFTLNVGSTGLTMQADGAAPLSSYSHLVTDTTTIFTVQASGGGQNDTYTYAITSGNSDGTLALDPSGAFSVSGTGTATTYSTVVITATDKYGLTGTMTFSLTTTASSGD